MMREAMPRVARIRGIVVETGPAGVGAGGSLRREVRRVQRVQ
jgi:hypothetical protein